MSSTKNRRDAPAEGVAHEDKRLVGNRLEGPTQEPGVGSRSSRDRWNG